MPTGRAGKVTIDIEQLNATQLRILIKDNGIGIDHKTSRPDGHNSYGTELTAQRLRLLQKLLKQPYTVSISGSKNNGTLVEITLPLRKQRLDMADMEEKMVNK